MTSLANLLPFFTLLVNAKLAMRVSMSVSGSEAKYIGHLPVPDIHWTGTSYRDVGTGRFIGRAAVRRTLEQSLANLTQLTDSLTEALRAGAISPQEFREEMRLVIKQTTLAAHELAVGGRRQMTQADYGKVGQQVRAQYQFLENWIQQLETGQAGPHAGRAIQYLRASRSYFLAMEAEVMTEKGFLARSVLRTAEHCAECLAERDKGLVPVEFLVPIGERQCKGNCKCFFVYERAA